MVRRNAFVMVIDRNGHNLFRVFLAHHVFIQPRLDHMGRGDLFQIKGRLFRLLFPLQLLALRLHEVHVGKIDHADVRHMAVLHHVVDVEAGILHPVKGFLHAVTADAEIPLETDQLLHLALRPSADIAEAFELFLFFVRLFPLGVELL